MKLATLLLIVGFSATAVAETFTIEGIHNCCKGCENGIGKAVETVKGASLTSSTKTSATVEAKGKSDAKKILAALEDAGYYGTIDGATESTAPAATASDKQMKGATVSGLHLCCKTCADEASKAVTSVAGVTGHTIKSKAKSFEVQGEFSQQALITALNGAGFSGKVK
jgi:copper chaperone CopZ